MNQTVHEPYYSMSWPMYNMCRFCAHLMWMLTYICWLFDYVVPKWDPVFPFSILCCSQKNNHLENNLAKFGYTPNMNGFLKKGSFYVFGFLLEHIIKIWRFGIFFIKIKWGTPWIEGITIFYGMQIQEETTIINEFGPCVPWIPLYGMKSYFSSHNLA
jgi:hypothetical protein